MLKADIEAVLKLFPEDFKTDDAKLQTLAQVFRSTGPSAAIFPEDAADDEKRATLKGELDGVFEAIKQAEMVGFVLTILGGVVGMLSFGPLCERIGRRGTFLFFQLSGFAIALLLFKGFKNPSPAVLWVGLPIFGGLTGGMHAGFAIYFPELFPTRLRGTGGGFCFNAGRLLAVPVLFLSGWMQKDWGFRLEDTVAILSFLFLLGVVALFFAPETKGQDLPE